MNKHVNRASTSGIVRRSKRSNAAVKAAHHAANRQLAREMNKAADSGRSPRPYPGMRA